jgi:hypothetical protein
MVKGQGGQLCHVEPLGVCGIILRPAYRDSHGGHGWAALLAAAASPLQDAEQQASAARCPRLQPRRPHRGLDSQLSGGHDGAVGSCDAPAARVSSRVAVCARLQRARGGGAVSAAWLNQACCLGVRAGSQPCSSGSRACMRGMLLGSTDVSSCSSRAAAVCRGSFSSTKPPGRAHMSCAAGGAGAAGRRSGAGTWGPARAAARQDRLSMAQGTPKARARRCTHAWHVSPLRLMPPACAWVPRGCWGWPGPDPDLAGRVLALDQQHLWRRPLGHNGHVHCHRGAWPPARTRGPGWAARGGAADFISHARSPSGAICSTGRALPPPACAHPCHAHLYVYAPSLEAMARHAWRRDLSQHRRAAICNWLLRDTAASMVGQPGARNGAGAARGELRLGHRTRSTLPPEALPRRRARHADIIRDHLQRSRTTRH